MATGQQAEPQTSKLMDPVCGLRVERPTEAPSSEYRGRVYYFHAPACKAEFDANPARFASTATDAAEGRAHDEGRGNPEARADPVCGMRVPDATGGALHASFDGVTYAFCSEECRREFLHKPERFVRSISYEPGRHAAG